MHLIVIPFALITLGVIILCASMSVDGNTSADEWENNSNITSMVDVWDFSMNSIDETLVTVRSQEVYLWGLNNHSMVKRIHMQATSDFIDMDWSDNQRLYVWAHYGGGNGDEEDLWWSDLVIVDENGNPVDGYLPYGTIEPYQERIVAVEWCPTSAHIAVAHRDGTVRIIDVSDNTVLIWKEAFHTITQLSWSPNGNLLAIVQNDKSNNTDKMSFIDLPNNHSWYGGRLQGIVDIDWSSDGRSIFLSSHKGIYQIDPGLWESSLINRATGLYIAACPTATVMAMFGDIGVTFWDYDSNISEYHHSSLGQMPFGEWTQDGSHLYTVEENEIIRIWRKRIPLPKPHVGISTPLKGTEVFDTINITGWASSSMEDTLHVLIQVNNLNWTPVVGLIEWHYLLDTRKTPDGMLKLRVWAHDVFGSSDISILTVYVRNGPPPENDPPSITIISPENGTHVWGILSLVGEASDDHSVVAVQVKIGVLRWRSIPIDTPGNQMSWTHHEDVFFMEEADELVISARSFDGVFFSPVETRIVSLQPAIEPKMNLSVEIISPTRGDTIPPSFTVRGIVTEGTAEEVFLHLDKEELVMFHGTVVWSYDIADLVEGSHVIRAIARNGTTYSDWHSVPFFVVKDIPYSNRPPEINITDPEHGSSTSTTFIVKGWSFDDLEVIGVEVMINDGEWIAANGTESWSFQVIPEGLVQGWNLIQARSYDGETYGLSDTLIIKYTDDSEPEPEVRETSPIVIFLILVALGVIIVLFSILLVKLPKREE